MEKNTIPFNGTKEQEKELMAVIEQHKGQDGAAIPVLHKAQEIYGYLPIEVQEMIAEGLNVPLAEIYGIVTFYAQFSLNPKGKYNIGVCLGTACYVKGSGDILERVCELIPEEAFEEEDEDAIKVAVIGRPNAGKSSLVNKILGEERMIVSNIAGTTRDAIDTKVENESGKYVFIDTAGIRKSGKIEDRIEKYSVLRAELAVERSDVCIIMVDATEGITAQDERVAGIAHENGKASIMKI